jgi:sugar phosphate isomerase/epimerase
MAADIRISCADYTWPSVSFPHALATIADIGVRAVDIALFASGSHLELDAVTGDPLHWAAVVHDLLRKSDLEVADVFLIPGPDLESLAPTSSDPSEQRRSREIFSRILTFAGKLGSPGITILPGAVPRDQTRDSALERAVRELSLRVAMAHEAGLRCSIEPHVGGIIETPRHASLLVDAVKGLEITLDLSHFAYQGFDLRDVAALTGFARHVQLRPADVGKMQTRVCEDKSDIGGLIRHLRAESYRGFVALEYVWMEKWNCNRVDNTTETVELNALVRSILAAGQGGKPR